MFPNSLPKKSHLTPIPTDMQTTIAALGQAIMQQQRPRGLMAPMQFALTMRVHDDCPGLLNDLFRSGFCLSEDEAKLFKSCAALDHPNPFSSMQGKFGWIIGDNFDHNKITLTGHDTIHVMGLMMTETPSTIPPHRIKRFGRDILNQKPKDIIPIKDIKQINSSNLDMLWKISLAYKEEKIGWQGYMTAITRGEHTGKASFHFLPMVDLNPNSWKCIYSVLKWGIDECAKYGIIPMFTFDQPIWWGARQLKNQEEDLSQIILNLGAFHTDMSFLGTIGHIMQSSGLKQLLTLVYPENTIRHIFSGKAVYRAMRGYFLVDAALNIFILKNYLFKDEQEASYFLNIFDNTFENYDEKKAINDEKMSDICCKFKEVKEKLKEYPTGELWVQFMDLVDNVKASHRAQRTGDFKMYFKSLQNKQPYFPASGHNNYGKSVPIFIQDMLSLENTNPEAWKCYNDGFFFVRRSDRFWAALSPDLVIEQVLMALLKNCKSGLIMVKELMKCRG